MKASTRTRLISLGAMAVASLLLTLFVKNYISGERKIKQRIPRRYDIAGGLQLGSCVLHDYSWLV